MTTRTILTVAASVLLGLLLGLAIRRARMPAPLTALDARAQLPSRSRIQTALLRAEIRDLNARLAALRDEAEGLTQEKLRLASLATPPPPSPESIVRANLRLLLGERRINIDSVVLAWLEKDPANLGVMIQVASEVFRERDWGGEAYGLVAEFYTYFLNNITAEGRQRILDVLSTGQRTETDLLKRSWMLGLLDTYGVSLPAEQIAEIVRMFRESKEPYFRDAAFPLLLRDPAANADLIRDVLREGAPEERTRFLLKAWDKRALPGRELRGLAKELMASDNPGALIMDAQEWVPKFINPLAPQETVALFDQTLAKSIPAIQKAISMMVMGSIATLFPSQPGRAEIDRFVSSTDDPHLKDFGGKVISLIDEGKGYAEIRKLNPIEFGFELPKK